MLSPAAAGQRFIASSEFLRLGEVAAFLRERLGERAAKVPTVRLPDFVVRGLALFNRPLSVMINRLSRRAEFSSVKAQGVLGWKPRPAREAILDCAESLIRLGLV